MDFRQLAADIQYWLLRLSEFGSAGKDRVPPTRPQLYPFATCGFDAKIWFVLGWFLFPRTSGNGRYGCGVHGKKSTEKRAIKRQPVVLESVMGIAVAASLYRMRSARRSSPLGIFESRLYSLAAAVSESASQ